jgi:acyl transferase domain-containing protein
MAHEEQTESISSPPGGIAVVGMVGRFPGARDLDTYWRIIREGAETLTFFSDDQLIAAGFDPQVVGNSAYVKARGVIEEIDLFDASFFGYSHREALLMDPQQRLFLQLSWEALEAAGCDPRSYRGLIGVYGGATSSSYQPILYSNPDGLGGADGLSIALGNELPFLTTRVSYKLDLKGPSCPVQTACSTSLVAVHLACQGLLNAECDMALAGGVSLRLPQEAGYFYQDESILSPDGHCRSFDANAAGTVFSNGAGIVVLKRVEDALADGDTIYAVIRGSAINNDGSRRASFTAPGVTGQSQVIADALASAEVDPETINYIEAHGTATSLGDSIEIQALTKAFGTQKRGYCAIGSVKANIGHLDTAAGVAGLIKTILALRHKQLPPTAHFTKANPDIHFETTPFYVNDRLREWKQPEDGPRRAGVSSFGFGGTNAHVVVEEAPSVGPTGPSRGWQLLTLSAETPDALEKVTSNLADHFSRRQADFADAAYTLKVGRRPFKHRRVAVCRSAEDAARILEARDPKTIFTTLQDGPARRAVFMFPGQGSQYVNMGRELYEQEPVFREVVDSAAASLRAHLGFDLREVLYPEQPSEALTARLTKTSVAQPALFVVEYATAKLLMSWGIKPEACIGHSVGEFVAACLAGVMSEEDALDLVALRGRLMEQMPAGAMLAIPLPEARVSRLLGEGLWLAAVNHASLTIVSGDHAHIEALEKRLQDEGVESQRLHTSHAFHSGMMDGAIAPFVAAVRQVTLKAPEIPYISNVSGTWIQASEATDPAYWGRQIREAVRFSTGVAELLQKADRVYVEAGPGNTLGTLVRRQATTKTAQSVFSTLRHAREEGSDCASLLAAVGRLWASGVAIDWDAFYRDEERRRVAMPPYPFDRQKYWPAPPAPAKRGAATRREKPQGRVSDIDAWFYAPTWRQEPLPIADGRNGVDRTDTWLVCLDSSGVGQRIVDRLSEVGHDVVAVESSDRFRRIGPGRFAIDPTSRDDFASVLRELSAGNRVPAVVLHMFGVGEVHDAESSVRDYTSDMNQGFVSLLALAQALNNADVTSPIRLAVVTNDAFGVTGHEVVAPGKAIALGLCKVIPQEYPTISCGCIDLTWDGSGVPLNQATVDRVVHDAANGSAAVVAYRGGRRWVLNYSELPLGEVPAVPPRLRPNGVYLITGGLGDMGLNMAKYLVNAVQARVVLTGRTRLPEAAEWDQYVRSNSPHDPIVQRIRRLQELKALGGDVLVVRADASEAGEMRAAFEAAERTFGAVHGVIHAAGLVAGDAFRPISETDADLYGRQFQPKIAGLCVLDELLAERPVDFCVLISSLSSLLGGLRYAAYASANAYMDAFAFRRNRTSPFPWLTINWDNWMRTEDEARLAESKTAPAGFVMTPTEGIDAFRRLLSSDWGVQMVVSTGDLQARLDQWVEMKGLKEDEPSAQAQHARPNLQTEYVAPRNDLEKAIAGIWQELLGVDRVGVNDNFFELGGDSFLGIQVISRLKRQLGVKVSAVTLYEGPRVALLAEIINAGSEQKTPAFDSSRQRGERRRGRKLGADQETEVLGASPA